MGYLNRNALIVKPKQPFVDWANGLGDGGPTTTLDAVREDCSVWLIEEVLGSDEAEAVIRQEWGWFFEHELRSWMEAPETWPPNRTYEMFREWFDVEFHSGVFNLVDEPVAEEE